MNKLLFSQRQKIKRVVDVAEDLLGYRLNRLNNSLLWTSLNRPGMTVAVSSHSPAIQESLPVNSENVSAIRDDEAKVILRWIDKLKGSEHPLLKYTRQFDTGTSLDRQEFSSSAYQIRSMIVLLVANMFGVPVTNQSSANIVVQPSENICSSTDSAINSVESKQKALAEIAETIYTAHMLHRTVVEIPKEELPTLSLGKVDSTCASDDGASPEEMGISMHQGNKVATLMGDLLLARCSKALYSLKNSRVTEMMSDSIADFSESEAIALSARVLISNHRTIGYNALPTSKDLKLILSFDKWLRRSSLGIGSLLENACYSSLIFSGQENEVRLLAGKIGHKIGLALQAHKDYMTFENELDSSPQIDLCSLPVIFQLENNSNLVSSGDVKQIHEEVRNSSYAKAKTRQTLLVLTDDAIRHVSKFSGSSSKLLQDFLATLSS